MDNQHKNNMLNKKLLFKSLLGLLIVSLAVLPLISQAAASDKFLRRIYSLTIDFDKTGYAAREVSLVNGKAPDRATQPQTGFRCEVVSANDEILYSFLFNLPDVLCSDSFLKTGNTGGCAKKDEGSFTLVIPYYSTGRNINIYDLSGKMVLFADISEFARICGDNICQANENNGNCSKDCKSGISDNYCDGIKDGVCDSDCSSKTDPDCARPIGNFWLLVAVIIALLAAGFGGYFIFRKIKKAGKEGSLEE